jgi:NNP family nitrate/nitrite transporter-like MFS transporter
MNSPQHYDDDDDDDDHPQQKQDPLLLIPPSESSTAAATTSSSSSRRTYGAIPQRISATEATSTSTSPHAYDRSSVRLVIAPRSQHHHPPPHGAGGIFSRIFHRNKAAHDEEEDEEEEKDDDDDDDEEFLLGANDRLLERARRFTLQHSAEKGYRATEMKFCSMARPHMRAMHASWICFFASYFVQFAMAPLLPQLQISLNLSKRDIWATNVWMMIGGVPMRFLLGPLCDTYGPRVVMVYMVALCSIACALSGVLVVDLGSLLVLRFIIGAMDAFVPCQCWITSHFVREVGGTIMATAGGLGASGSAFTQLAVGFLFAYSFNHWTDGNMDLAWRIVLLFPAAFGLCVAYFSYMYTDDCPLGNFVDVKRAGLMMERSAVDSFRSGVYNVNSWLLFLLFAGSCGVDVTMCNGCAIYFHDRFDQNIASVGAIAFLYGGSAVYARGLGGYVSDYLGNHFSLAGRLWLQFICMLLQGVVNIWFARTDELQSSIIVMFIMSIVIQVRFFSRQSWSTCSKSSVYMMYRRRFLKIHHGRSRFSCVCVCVCVCVLFLYNYAILSTNIVSSKMYIL